MANLQKILKIHSKDFDAVTQDIPQKRLWQLYKAGVKEISLKMLEDAGKDYTMSQHVATLIQLKKGMAKLVTDYSAALAGESSEVYDTSTKIYVRMYKDLRKTLGRGRAGGFALPIQQASQFQAARKGRQESLLRTHIASMNTYGVHTIRLVQTDLSLSLLTGETTHQAVERVRKRATIEYWRAERIVRTELAWAYNAAQTDAIEATPGMWRRWAELVDDATGQPLDKRVAIDSIIMHGQVVQSGQSFKMPSDSRTPKSLVGGTWDFPPNRPNDRARVEPWHPDWADDVPGWQNVGGQKVPVKAPPVDPSEPDYAAEDFDEEAWLDELLGEKPITTPPEEV